MDHAPDEHDASKLYFRVAMCGCPPKEGETVEWCMRKDLLKDHAQPLIDKHIEEHANYSPYSDPLVPKRTRKEKVEARAELVDRSSPCEHKNYQVSFKMEDHPGFCFPGKYLHGLNCGGPGCKRTFAPTLKEVKRLGKDKASRPAADKPVHCCVNAAVEISRKSEEEKEAGELELRR
jgi:hypothetical protein